MSCRHMPCLACTLPHRLIIRGRMELEETLMLWKGESHIQGLFDQSPCGLHK